MRSTPGVRALLAACTVLAFAGAGCLGFTGSEEADAFPFDASPVWMEPGAFEAAPSSGQIHGYEVESLGAREDPGVPGEFFSSLPFDHPGLDSSWGPGTYALGSLHWWGPDGMAGDPGGQGFLADGFQVQAILGPDTPDVEVRALAREYLANVSAADANARDAWLEDFIASEEPAPWGVESSPGGIEMELSARGFRGPLPEPLRLGALFDEMGGEGGLRSEGEDAVGWVRFSGSNWWFDVDVATKRLEGREHEGFVAIDIDARDRIQFTLEGRQHHSDEETDIVLERVFDELGLPGPSLEPRVFRHEYWESD